MKRSTITTDRRAFLGFAAATAAGAAALSAGSAKADTEKAEERAEAGGYRETEHVRAAYDRMRF